MGGPGVIFSKGLLKQLKPKLRIVFINFTVHFGQKVLCNFIDLKTGESECFDKLLTDHEDIELGRCVWRLTGMPCTKASDADRYYFYQDYKKIDKEKNTGHGYNR